ncbi:MAG: 5'-nucleotidase C-terminal domain-containing protein [bacterium]
MRAAKSTCWRGTLSAAALAVFASHAPAASAGTADFRLTVLHTNDTESQLIDAGTGLEDFGGAARAKSLARKLRREALRVTADIDSPSGPIGRNDVGVVMLSSGDNYLAGPEFNASLDHGVPYYDTIAMEDIGYDVFAIGNHEFDFGPDVLENFIAGFQKPVPFVSANLDVSNEPGLQALADQGRIAPSTVLTVAGRRVGIVGATTPSLPFISSPRAVIVNAVLPAVQSAVDDLTNQGVDIVILISHLQSISEDLDLAPMLRDVDLMIAGGGDELLANPGTPLVPGDEGQVFGTYPMWATDANGVQVPVVTTSGNYKYVGRCVAEFDVDGNLVNVGGPSGPVRVVTGDYPDAVTPDPSVQTRVIDPVVAYLDDLATTVIGTSEVDLDGVRANVRTRETNEGDLIADALRWQATELAGAFGQPVPQVALQNGGGIRNDNVEPAGNLSELQTFDMVPFANFVSIVPSVPRDQFKEILENAVSRVEFVDGRFAQISGFSFTWDPAGTGQQLDADGNVVVAGTRVTEVVLDDATVIVTGGVVQPGAALDVATINFLAASGDQYPFRGAAYTTLGVTYQQAVSGYITDGLSGVVTDDDYPLGGEGRVVELGAGARTPARGTTSATVGRFATQAPFPNPSLGPTSIDFVLPHQAPVSLRVLDVRGRVVSTPIAATLAAGRHTADWDGTDRAGRAVGAGVYFLELRAGKEARTSKVLVVR